MHTSSTRLQDQARAALRLKSLMELMNVEAFGHPPSGRRSFSSTYEPFDKETPRQSIHQGVEPSTGERHYAYKDDEKKDLVRQVAGLAAQMQQLQEKNASLVEAEVANKNLKNPPIMPSLNGGWKEKHSSRKVDKTSEMRRGPRRTRTTSAKPETATTTSPTRLTTTTSVTVDAGHQRCVVSSRHERVWLGALRAESGT